jgi:hypothetical protein
MDELTASGAFDDAIAEGDAIDRELSAARTDEAVEEELAALQGAAGEAVEEELAALKQDADGDAS